MTNIFKIIEPLYHEMTNYSSREVNYANVVQL